MKQRGRLVGGCVGGLILFLWASLVVGLGVNVKCVLVLDDLV